jgi:outer membrane protein OmpA-like peptidoglycan-associated protein
VADWDSAALPASAELQKNDRYKFKELLTVEGRVTQTLHRTARQGGAGGLAQLRAGAGSGRLQKRFACERDCSDLFFAWSRQQLDPTQGFKWAKGDLVSPAGDHYSLSAALSYEQGRLLVGTLGQPGREATVLLYNSLAVNPHTEQVATYLAIVEPKTMASGQVTVDASALQAGLAAEGRVALSGLFFDTGKAELKAESRPQLEAMAELLRKQPALKAWIVGHTDNVGSFDANEKLSLARAQAVVAALTAAPYQVEARRLTARGWPAWRPWRAMATRPGARATAAWSWWRSKPQACATRAQRPTARARAAKAPLNSPSAALTVAMKAAWCSSGEPMPVAMPSANLVRKMPSSSAIGSQLPGRRTAPPSRTRPRGANSAAPGPSAAAKQAPGQHRQQRGAKGRGHAVQRQRQHPQRHASQRPAAPDAHATGASPAPPGRPGGRRATGAARGGGHHGGLSGRVAMAAVPTPPAPPQGPATSRQPGRRIASPAPARAGPQTRPRLSSTPRCTFMLCTAAPLAPLPRLSRRAISSTCVSLANTNIHAVGVVAGLQKKPLSSVAASRSGSTRMKRSPA